MSDALFLFTIGPVKSMIEQSRKTRDLYAGSFLLSYLLSGAIEKLDKQSEDVDIIFPSRHKDTNIPNRLVAIVKGNGPEEQKKLGRTLARYVQDRFMDICLGVFHWAGVTPNRWVLEQLERFLEVYWVFEPLEQYESSYKQLIQSMNNIKRLRVFTQSNELYGRKCAIYPEYNAIFIKRTREGKLPDFVVSDHAVDVSSVPACMYALKPGEGLSAIAFVKRMLHLLTEPEAGDKTALSGYRLNISSVAYMLLHSRLGSSYADKLARLKDEASEALFDLQNGQTLSTEEYSPDSIDIALKLYREIQNQYRISPYYALVKFDGDGMGRLYQDYADRAAHRQLSQDISHFASNVRAIIAEHRGICIYAGGEDFLGFLPLDTLFSALLKLREEFSLQVRAPLGHPKPLTFSAGIAIAHLMQPLQEVLARTGELESLAKGIDEDKDSCASSNDACTAAKNAFAIELMKRSGENVTIKNKFGEKGENLQVLQHALAAITNKQDSKAFIHNLSRMLARLQDKDEHPLDAVVRVLIRQAYQRANPGMGRDERDQHTERFYALYQAFGANISRFIPVLQMTAFLSREVDPCYMPSMR